MCLGTVTVCGNPRGDFSRCDVVRQEDESSTPPPLQLSLSTLSRNRADTDASMVDQDAMADDDTSHPKDSASAPEGDNEGAQEARSELLRARDAVGLHPMVCKVSAGMTARRTGGSKTMVCRHPAAWDGWIHDSKRHRHGTVW